MSKLGLAVEVRTSLAVECWKCEEPILGDDDLRVMLDVATGQVYGAHPRCLTKKQEVNDGCSIR